MGKLFGHSELLFLLILNKLNSITGSLLRIKNRGKHISSTINGTRRQNFSKMVPYMVLLMSKSHSVPTTSYNPFVNVPFLICKQNSVYT